MSDTTYATIAIIIGLIGSIIERDIIFLLAAELAIVIWLIRSIKDKL